MEYVFSNALLRLHQNVIVATPPFNWNASIWTLFFEFLLLCAHPHLCSPRCPTSPLVVALSHGRRLDWQLRDHLHAVTLSALQYFCQ